VTSGEKARQWLLLFLLTIQEKAYPRALPADNSRKSISKNYTPSPSVHDNEAINIAKECPFREVLNTYY